jgi:protein ImuA
MPCGPLTPCWPLCTEEALARLRFFLDQRRIVITCAGLVRAPRHRPHAKAIVGGWLCGRNGAIDGAAAALFAAGIAVRTQGRVLWCVTGEDLFAPALASAGLAPDQVIYVEAGDEKAVLVCLEEALRHRKLGAVVAEVSRLSMTPSPRLQLAAEGSGVIGLALRRWRRQAQAAELGQLTASTRRWRVSALRSTPLPVPGVGRARWRLELQCRRGESAEFEVEACDAQGRLALPAEPAHRSIRAARARM